MAVRTRDVTVDSTLSGYKLNIGTKRLIIFENENLKEITYLFCSLCSSEMYGLIQINNHLRSGSHCKHVKKSVNIMYFVVEDKTSLLIYDVDNLSYLFNLCYANSPYKFGVGIGDERFITIMNKLGRFDNSKTDIIRTANMEDFDVVPQELTSECSVVLLIDNGEDDEVFNQNFMLYEFSYSVMRSTKYFVINLNVWRYLINQVVPIKHVICSCKKVVTMKDFKVHLSQNNCKMLMGISCCKCSQLCLFASGHNLTHVHGSNSGSVINRIGKKKSNKQEQLNTKTTKQSNELQHKKEIKTKTKVDNVDGNLLSKMVVGSIGFLESPEFKTLQERITFYTYKLHSRELLECCLDEFDKINNITSVICWICNKVCKGNASITPHFKSEEHIKKLSTASPVTVVYLEDIFQVIICKIEEINCFQHFIFKKINFNNIILGDENSINIILYNFKENNIKIRLDSKLYCDDLLVGLGGTSQNIVRITKFENDKKKSLFIFQYYSNKNDIVDNDNNLQNESMDELISITKKFKKICGKCKKTDKNRQPFLKHSCMNCDEHNFGLICHQCKTMTSILEDNIRHVHTVPPPPLESKKREKEDEAEEGSVERKQVKKIQTKLHENIEVKEFSKIVKQVTSFSQVDTIPKFHKFLFNSLPLNKLPSKIVYVCLICDGWQGCNTQEMFDHTYSPAHIRNKEIGNVEDLVWVCDICNCVLIDSQSDMANVHVEQRHPKLVKSEDHFVIQQDENHVTINLLSNFSCNLLESYVEMIEKNLNNKNKVMTVFCIMCFKTFDYNIDNFHNHVSSHKRGGKDGVLAYCKFCNVLLYLFNTEWIVNHFNYHCFVNERKKDSLDCQQMNDLSLSDPSPFDPILHKVAMYSASDNFIIKNNVYISAFQYLNNVVINKLYKHLSFKCSKKNNFHFHCLQCNVKGSDEIECIKHFKIKTHAIDNASRIHFIDVCNFCRLLLVGTSLKDFYEHFESGSHFYNERIEIIEKMSKEESDINRFALGFITQMCESIFSSKNNCDSFVKETLLEYIRAENGLESIRTSFLKDINRVIANQYPRAEIYFFGSRISGLAKSDSDVDIFIDFGSDNIKNLIPLFKMANVRGLFNIKEEILFAKVPIIKLNHKNTGLSCDISCQDGYGVYNSLLVKLYINLDERVHKLCAIVLEWAKMNDIRGSPKFTSYSLTWMVLFFLMQRDVCLVPTVSWLQDNYTGRKTYINGWHCTFCRNIPLILQEYNPNNCTLTLHQLIYKFFMFYIILDVNSVILFPFTGEIIPNNLMTFNRAPIFLKNIFFKKNGMKIIKSSGFTLMDPFILNYNIVHNIDTFKLKLFRALAVHTVKQLTTWAKPNVDKPLSYNRNYELFKKSKLLSHDH